MPIIGGFQWHKFSFCGMQCYTMSRAALWYIVLCYAVRCTKLFFKFVYFKYTKYSTIWLIAWIFINTKRKGEYFTGELQANHGVGPYPTPWADSVRCPAAAQCQTTTAPDGTIRHALRHWCCVGQHRSNIGFSPSNHTRCPPAGRVLSNCKEFDGAVSGGRYLSGNSARRNYLR